MIRRNRILAAALLTVLAAADLGAEDRRVGDRAVADWVKKRVADWQPTADERRFDDIGWVSGIREALRLAKEHARPVFLFTHDGHMAVGRC